MPAVPPFPAIPSETAPACPPGPTRRASLAGLAALMLLAGCAAPPPAAPPAPAQAPVPPPPPPPPPAPPPPPPAPPPPPPDDLTAKRGGPPPVRMGLLTLLEGDAIVIRDNIKLVAAEGLAMFSGDIVETGGNGRHVRIEFSDGTLAALGPDTRVQLAPGLAGNRAAAAQKVYLLNGWLKLTASRTTPMGLASATFDLTGVSQGVVVQLLPRSAALFVEAGEATLRTLLGPAAATTKLKGGDFALPGRPGTAVPKTQITARPAPAFLQSLPSAFLDERPPRAASFAGKEARPRKAGDISYADIHYWINGEALLRRANLARFRPLAQDPAFRQSLQTDMRLHPEWEAALAAP